MATNAEVQFNLGVKNAGLAFRPEAHKWYLLAAEQGHQEALKALEEMQRGNLFPDLRVGTTVTTVLLTSAAESKYNHKTGKVVAGTKLGAVAVQLNGNATPISFKLMNLRVLS